MLYKLTPQVNLDALTQALHAVVARHEVLHSLIKVGKEGNGYQEVCDLTLNPVQVEFVAVSTLAQAGDLLTQRVNKPFSLDVEYPLRILVLEYRGNLADKLSQELLHIPQCYLLVVAHHIAFDGWSAEVFLRDLFFYYASYLAKSGMSDSKEVVDTGSTLNLPELSVQYRDFAVWQRSYLSGERLELQIKYWKNKLSGFNSLNLPTDKPRPALVSYAGDEVEFNLSPECSTRLRQLARELGVGLYSVLLSGFYLLLRAYSHQDDIVVGSPIANRHHEQLENMVGFFVNSLALRSEINPEETLSEYICRTGTDIIDAQLHQDLPFERLVDELQLAKDTRRHPVFQVYFGVQKFGLQETIKQLNLADTCHNLQAVNIFDTSDKDNIFTELVNKIEKPAKFDLMLLLDDSRPEIKGTWAYATSIYSPKTLRQFTQTYT